MNVDSLRQSVNESLEALWLHLEQFISVLTLVIIQIKEQINNTTINWNYTSPVEFTPLQVALLKVLLILLLITAALITCSWRIYGKDITEKFVRQSTLKEIEELKLSVAKLKLPKEHTPRI